MSKRVTWHVLLAGVVATLLALTGPAWAGTDLHTSPGLRKMTLSPAQLRQVIDTGLRVPVTSSQAIHYQIRMFVYERSLIRGGMAPNGPASWRMWVTQLAHVDFTRPGTQYVTLRVDHVYRPSLERAGSVIVGVAISGYR